MPEQNHLAQLFDAHRSHLRGVAYRMLGSLSEADDAVQEAWLRLNRSETDGVENLGGWLTTVVARICLDQLRAQRSRGEEALDLPAVEHSHASSGTAAEDEAVLADSIGLALLVVLQTLSPAERIAFVLHDLFDLPFEEIATVLGRNSAATRQLASRARRRVQGRSDLDEINLTRQREVVDAFLAASRGGDFHALLNLLDPDVVFTSDPVHGAPAQEAHGAETIARLFQGRATLARSALVDGNIGAVVAPNGRLLLVLRFRLKDGRIAALEAVATPERLAGVQLGILGDA